MLPNTRNNGKWTTNVVVCFLLCLVPFRTRAQNLVPNPSFEIRDTCLEINTAYQLGTGPLGWFSASGTGDYFTSCLPLGAFNSVPLNAWSFQDPQDGDSYVGVMTYDQAFGGREWFMVELSAPLMVGQTYYASFYANAAWGGYEPYPQMWVASSHVGILFTKQPKPWQIGDLVPSPGNFAHVYHPWVISDTVGWTLVSGSFVADSAYQYLMIGNHFDNASTDTIHFADYPWNPRASVLIDNVCVSTNPNGCPMTSGVPENSLDAIDFYPNPATTELVLEGLTIGTRLVIYNALGQVIWEDMVSIGLMRINVLAWSRGSYVLRLEKEGKSRSYKFVLTE